MIICSVNNVAQSYGGTQIFEGLSLELKENDRIGIVGRNGSGKTTLMKILAQTETPISGEVFWKKECKIGYLSQIPTHSDKKIVHSLLRSSFSSLIEKEEKMKQLESDMTQTTNTNELDKIMSVYGKLQESFAYEGGYEIEASIQHVAQGLNIVPLLDQEFTHLSGGEQTKIGLAMNLLRKPDLLLLDEPTNHLDFLATEWLENYLSDYQGTVAVISHDRYFLDKVATKMLDIEDGEATIYHTNFSSYIKEKEEKILREFQAYEEHQRKIKKMKERAKTLREWANQAKPPNSRLHKQARNMERMIERMEQVKKPHITKKIGLEIQSTQRSGKEVVVAKDVSKSFNHFPLFENVSLHIRFKERVALVGENGSGKSTLLHMLLQEFEPDSGTITIGSNVKIGYLSQHIFSNVHSERVIDLFRNEVSVTEGQARHILAKFLFFGTDVFQKVSALSGGEKMRLRLAQLMHQQINFLILDEPTNHLDIETREVLEETLETFEGTLLVVSHDRYFLDTLFEKIYWIHSNQLFEFPGNYSWARKKMLERE